MKYVCNYYLNIADQVLAGPEGVVPQEVPDREVFSLRSDVHPTPGAEAGEELSVLLQAMERVVCDVHCMKS